MFTVQYTIAKTIKGEFMNLYKSRKFRLLSDATDFYNRMMGQSNVCDVRMFSR